jgi:hypothetical protein
MVRIRLVFHSLIYLLLYRMIDFKFKGYSLEACKCDAGHATSMPVVRFNIHYDYIRSYTSIYECATGRILLNPNILICGAQVSHVTQCFLYFRLEDLRLLCTMH